MRHAYLLFVYERASLKLLVVFVAVGVVIVAGYFTFESLTQINIFRESFWRHRMYLSNLSLVTRFVCGSLRIELNEINLFIDFKYYCVVLVGSMSSYQVAWWVLIGARCISNGWKFIHLNAFTNEIVTKWSLWERARSIWVCISMTHMSWSRCIRAPSTRFKCNGLGR